jgi:fatty-acyl-CoA synthase
LNYRLLAADHEYILNHAGVTTLLVDWEYTKVVDEIRPRLTSARSYVVAQESGEAPAGWLDWETLIAREPDTAPAAPARGENDVVSINYTSGTTGRPKGVMLTHRNCYLNAYNLIAHLRVAHDDIELWTLPMFHCNGWGGVYALTGMGGTHVVLRAIDAAASSS